MVTKINKADRFSLLKIALITSLAIICVKALNTLLVYNFFNFDNYLAAVAVIFLFVGYFLSHRKGFGVQKLATVNADKQNEELET